MQTYLSDTHARLQNANCQAGLLAQPTNSINIPCISYGTAQYKLDIRTRVLVVALEIYDKTRELFASALQTVKI